MPGQDYRNDADYSVYNIGGTVTPYVPTTIACGEIIVGTAAAQFSSVACKNIIFKASKANAGTVYIGGSGVTLPNGTADATTGLQLVAGDDTPEIHIDNLNRFYGIASAAAQTVMYLVTL